MENEQKKEISNKDEKDVVFVKEHHPIPNSVTQSSKTSNSLTESLKDVKSGLDSSRELIRVKIAEFIKQHQAKIQREKLELREAQKQTKAFMERKKARKTTPKVVPTVATTVPNMIEQNTTLTPIAIPLQTSQQISFPSLQGIQVVQTLQAPQQQQTIFIPGIGQVIVAQQSPQLIQTPFATNLPFICDFNQLNTSTTAPVSNAIQILPFNSPTIIPSTQSLIPISPLVLSQSPSITSPILTVNDVGMLIESNLITKSSNGNQSLVTKSSANVPNILINGKPLTTSHSQTKTSLPLSTFSTKKTLPLLPTKTPNQSQSQAHEPMSLPITSQSKTQSNANIPVITIPASPSPPSSPASTTVCAELPLKQADSQVELVSSSSSPAVISSLSQPSLSSSTTIVDIEPKDTELKNSELNESVPNDGESIDQTMTSKKSMQEETNNQSESSLISDMKKAEAESSKPSDLPEPRVIADTSSSSTVVTSREVLVNPTEAKQISETTPVKAESIESKEIPTSSIEDSTLLSRKVVDSNLAEVKVTQTEVIDSLLTQSNPKPSCIIVKSPPQESPRLSTSLKFTEDITTNADDGLLEIETINPNKVYGQMPEVLVGKTNGNDVLVGIEIAPEFKSPPISLNASINTPNRSDPSTPCKKQLTKSPLTQSPLKKPVSASPLGDLRPDNSFISKDLQMKLEKKNRKNKAIEDSIESALGQINKCKQNESSQKEKEEKLDESSNYRFKMGHRKRAIQAADNSFVIMDRVDPKDNTTVSPKKKLKFSRCKSDIDCYFEYRKGEILKKRLKDVVADFDSQDRNNNDDEDDSEEDDDDFKDDDETNEATKITKILTKLSVKCEICGNSFLNEESVKRHMSRMHRTQLRQERDEKEGKERDDFLSHLNSTLSSLASKSSPYKQTTYNRLPTVVAAESKPEEVNGSEKTLKRFYSDSSLLVNSGVRQSVYSRKPPSSFAVTKPSDTDWNEEQADKDLSHRIGEYENRQSAYPHTFIDITYKKPPNQNSPKKSYKSQKELKSPTKTPTKTTPRQHSPVKTPTKRAVTKEQTTPNKTPTKRAVKTTKEEKTPTKTTLKSPVKAPVETPSSKSNKHLNQDKANKSNSTAFENSFENISSILTPVVEKTPTKIKSTGIYARSPSASPAKSLEKRSIYDIFKKPVKTIEYISESGSDEDGL